MDFESPDVAKEFPGLYMGDLEVGMKNEDDEEQDKSKKKKDKKKDKEKGYAALAGESSHDEDDDSKSPGKSKKIKAFKLTGSKKKDKEKDKELKPLDMQLQGSSILRTGSIREKRPFDREKKPSEKELRKSAEKEVKRQMSPAASSTANPRLSLPTSATTKVTHPPPERTHSLTKNLTLNAFLNAPAPLLKKKMTSTNSKDKESVKKDKDKSHKKDETKKAKDKEKELIPSLVRLKLKRGSKNSLEDSQSDSPVAPSHQFPESPDAIAKEIRRYEILLEQTHAQIKSSKKVSKKSEEQLWELQRTLTQLKRKLRSVNALSSASSANIVLSHSTSEKSAKDSEKSSASSMNTSSVPQIISKTTLTTATASIPIPKPISAERHVGSASLSPKPNCSGSSTSDVPVSEQLQPKLSSPINQVSPATTNIKSEPSPSTSLPLPDESRRISVHLDTSFDSTEESQHLSHVKASQSKKESTESAKNIELSKSPGATSLEKVQVHVQVHNNAPVEREMILTPEDIFEKEIESFDAKDGVEPTRNCPSPIIMGECPTVESSAKSEEVTPEDSVYDDDSEIASNDGDPLHDGDYPEIPEVEAKPLIDRSEESPDDFVPAFIVEEAVDDFDPFKLPIFQTDEFIAHENEALIGFNQKLQDEIVKEEERITALMDEYKYLTDAGYKKNAMEDLKSLDDDELAELWYSRKLENEALHDKVSNLRKKVVTEILAEFRLETRLRYLQERASTTNPETSPVQLHTEG